MEIAEKTINQLIEINNAISELNSLRARDFIYCCQLLLDESNQILGDLLDNE